MPRRISLAAQLASPDPAADRFLVLRPNRSLSARGRTVLFVALAATAAALAAIFWLTGAWPVVAFFLLELATVGAVLCRVSRSADDCETITLDDDRLWVVARRANRETRHEFQRYWARACLTPQHGGWRPSRLCLRSHGRELEIGTDLQETQRRALARVLGRLVGPGYSPAARPEQSEFKPNPCS